MKTNRMAVVAAIVAMGVSCPTWAYITGVMVDSVTSQQDARLASYTIDSDPGTFDPVAGTLKATDRGWMTKGTDYPYPAIVYNLGAVYDLASIQIWNWNQTGFTLQGASSVNIAIAGANKVFAALGTETYALAQAPGADGYTGQSIAANVNDVKYVRVTFLTSGYATDGYYNRGGENWKNETGLGKVEFSAVPEPSALALGLVGLLAYAWRKRK